MKNLSSFLLLMMKTLKMKNWLKILLGLAVVGMIAAFLGYKFIYNKQHPNYENMDADFKIGAKALYDAYKTDATAAGQKYNGKVVEISGAVSNVEEVDTLVVAVFAFSEGMFGQEGIRVTMLPKFNEGLKNYASVEEIVLKGFCSGFNDTDVIIEKGSIVK